MDVTIESNGTHATIRPSRGGMVTELAVGKQPILYLDRATLDDETRNVRGGIPVLFPTPGKLADDRWARDGRSGSQKQHGFARTLPWTVVAQSPSALVLELAWDGTPDWPWACTYAITYTIDAGLLRIDQRVTNRSDTAMPFGLGFHPYFLVPDGDKGDASIVTEATRAFDNVTKTVGPVALDLTAAEVDQHLLDHGSTASALIMPAAAIRVAGSEAYAHWVVWTQRGKDFVCLEPWTCPGDAMNSGERLLSVEPGGEYAAWVEIRVSP